ncbi:hypothetical protein QUF63_02245 [Anaerolineales bacterium HSG25]|nr:hypothetical protein [Anaerolineales bacterium HSG25]
MPRVILQEKSYTSSDYFNLSYPTKDIIAEIGYTYSLQRISLPHGNVTDTLHKLKANFYKKLPKISLTSEATIRGYNR